VVHGATDTDYEETKEEQRVALFEAATKDHQQTPEGDGDVEDVRDGVPELGDEVADGEVCFAPVDCCVDSAEGTGVGIVCEVLF